ncbi:MAG: DUF2200 domain-containing protein [Erysipelotrichaceae bacterium]
MSYERLFATPCDGLYQMLVAKAERKGRSRAEVDLVTMWLLGYDQTTLDAVLASNVSYREFIEDAPKWNERASLITGTVCGIRVEEIEDPLIQMVRYLDKLVDELAKGKKLEKILR